MKKEQKWDYSVGKEIRRNMKAIIKEKGFKFWFKEVFWPHYGKISVCILAALIVGVFLSVEAMNKPRYDFHMVVAMEDPVAPADTKELQEVVANAVGDINGDGTILLDVQVINLGDQENLETNQQRLQLAFAQSEYTLYILDDMYSTTYCHREYFDPAADYGFTPDPEEDRRVDVSEAPVLWRMGQHIPGEQQFYACICDWTVDGKGDQELTDAAVRALEAIIETE